MSPLREAAERYEQPKINIVIKHYEILKSLPSYGEMYVSVSESGEPFYSEGFVVRFYKSDGKSWVGNFETGWTKFNFAHGIKDNLLLIVAGGIAYLMNPNETEPISVFGIAYEAVIKTNDNKFILQDSTDLTIVNKDGEKWITERISWDGIKDLKLNGNLISGQSFDPMYDKDEWVEFEVDIESRNIRGGSYGRYNLKNIKPWWKFW